MLDARLFCDADEAVAKLCYAKGDVNCAVLTRPTVFDVYLVDNNGNRFDTRNLSVTLTEMLTQRPVDVDVQRVEKGRYSCTYTASSSTIHKLIVLLAQQHISGSPFSVSVTTGLSRQSDK